MRNLCAVAKQDQENVWLIATGPSLATRHSVEV